MKYNPNDKKKIML